MTFERIPAELQACRQWCLWRYEETDKGRPTKVPYSVTGTHTKVNDSSTWCSFAEAVANAHKYSGIGFIITAADPYGFIDLDKPKNPDGSPLHDEEFQAKFEKQKLIHSEFDSYSELSPSGEGLHIIVKGKVTHGRRRDSVEVYSDLRFMTMTGQVINDKHIEDRQELLTTLWAQMGQGKSAEMFYAGLEKASFDNNKILQIAAEASNGEKFYDLYYNGNWQKYYPSQSEADFALVDILAFYSKNRAQVQQLFLSSKLAEREKSRAQYRINYMLNRCFDNLLPPVDFEGLRNQIEEVIHNNNTAKEIQKEVSRQSAVAIDQEKLYQNLPPPDEFPTDRSAVYSLPDGLVGKIAEFVFSQATRPVEEIAIAAAIGLMSGIVGKAYNVSATGLNQYTLLLAKTGTGKEAAAKGMKRLLKEVAKVVPLAIDFLGPSSIASAQALTKHLASVSPSFVAIVGEYGAYLKQMCSGPAGHMQDLKRLILMLYNQSGEGDTGDSIIYSDKEKNTGIVEAPNFSLFGESVPERFYEALDEGMIYEGFLPRFTVIEYKGDRVRRNEGAALAKPSEDLIKELSALCINALQLINQKKVVNVQYTEGALKILNEFNDFCDDKIYGAEDLKRELWNRGHLKVLKLAAIVAVGQHPYTPTINEEAAKWAIRIVLEDIKNIAKKFEMGDVGLNNYETKQTDIVVKSIKKFITQPWDDVKKMAGEKMKPIHESKMIPYSYLQRCTATAAPFKNDKSGATNALKRTLKILQDRGDLQVVAKADLVKRFGTGAECYAVSNVNSFGV